MGEGWRWSPRSAVEPLEKQRHVRLHCLFVRGILLVCLCTNHKFVMQCMNNHTDFAEEVDSDHVGTSFKPCHCADRCFL